MKLIFAFLVITLALPSLASDITHDNCIILLNSVEVATFSEKTKLNRGEILESVKQRGYPTVFLYTPKEFDINELRDLGLSERVFLSLKLELKVSSRKKMELGYSLFNISLKENQTDEFKSEKIQSLSIRAKKRFFQSTRNFKRDVGLDLLENTPFCETL